MKKRIVAILLAGMLALQGSVCYAAEGDAFSDGAEYAAAALTAESGQEMEAGESSGEETAADGMYVQEDAETAAEETNSGEAAASVTDEFTAGTESAGTETAVTPGTEETENTETETSVEPENTGSDISAEPETLETEEMETTGTGETESSEPETLDEPEILETEETGDSEQIAEADPETSEETEIEIASSFEAEEAENDLFFAGSSEASGTCGTNLTWTLVDGVLTISGAGDMDSMKSDCPWRTYSNEIKTVVIGEGVTGIGEAAFYQCYSLEEVSLPSSLKKIEDGAFVYCSKLKSLTLNEGLESLGSYVIQNTGITALTLPSTLSSIEELTFYMAYSLTSIEVAAGNQNFTSESGVLFNADKSTLLLYPAGKSDDYQIPSGVTTVNAYAFSYAKLKNVTIADTVTTLGDGVFYNSSIVSLVIPDSVTKIGYFLCESCTSLVSISMGSGLTALSYRAFYGCSKLKTVSFGANITDLDRLAFGYCTSLESIRIPDGVTSILNGSFGYCTSLKEVIFPAGLKEIAYQAFLKCENLSQITLPEGFEVVYRYAFWGTAITEVYLPASVTQVGEHAFPDETNLIFAEELEVQEDNSYLKALKASVSVNYDYESAFAVLDIVNQRRAENGLSALSMDTDLLEAAMRRAAELSIYYSHTRPTGKTCFTVNSKATAENIALGQGSASAVMESWMNSSGHKANILGSSYTGIGVGAVEIGGVHYWVQIFTSETPEVASASSYVNYTAVTDVTFTENDEGFKILPTVSKLSLEYGKKESVGMKFNNTYCTTEINEGQLTFTSEDPSVCSVSTSGEVTAVGPGSTKIQIAMTKYPQIAVSVSVTVSKAKLTAAYAGETVAYGETPKLAVTVTGFVNGDTEATAAGYTAPTLQNPYMDVGSYKMLPSGGTANNYEFRYTSGVLTIEPADPVYTEPAAKILNYNGKAQKLVSEGSTKDGTFTYSLTGKKNDYSTKVPTATESGVYTVYWKLTGDDNHNDKEGSVSVSIFGTAVQPVISLNASSLTLKKKQATSALKVTKMAEGDYVKSVKSSNTKIVKVTSFEKTGEISLKAQNKTGTAKLTITLASGLKKTIKVKVQKSTVKTKKLTVSSKKITLKKGKSKTLKITVNPITSQQKVTCKSSNKKVATVSADGTITAKKAGTAKITIKSGSKKVVVTVKVKK